MKKAYVGARPPPSPLRTRVTSNHFPLILDRSARPLVKHRVEVTLSEDEKKSLPERFRATIVDAYLKDVAPTEVAFDRDYILIAPRDLSTETEIDIKNQRFKIKIVKQDIFDLNHLLTIKDASLAQEPLQALDVLMGSAARTISDPIGRKGTWLHTESWVPLSRRAEPGELVLFKGHGQRVHLTNQSGLGNTKPQILSISFDARGEIGLLEVPVIDFLRSVCQIHMSVNKKWTAQDRRNAGAALGGLEASFAHKSGTAVLAPTLIAESASQYSFPAVADGKSITVRDYFREKYNINLKYPDAPLIKIKRRNDVLPLEMLIIVKQRRTKVSAAATVAFQRAMTMKPGLRRKEIMHARNLIAAVPLLKHYGVSIAPEPITSSAVILPAPTLRYAGRKEVMAKRGAWNMVDLSFPGEERPLKWGVVNCMDQSENEAIATWSTEFSTFGREHLNVNCAPPWKVLCAQPFDTDDPSCLSKVTGLLTEKNLKPDFVMVVKADTEEEEYEEIKRHFDKHGVVTQCVVKARTPGLNPHLKNAPDHWTNIWAKIQTKCGRICQQLTPAATLWSICDAETALLGADLCHPILKSFAHHDRATLPSYGSLVCSTNRELTRFTCSSRIHLGGTDELFQMQQMITSVMSKRSSWPKKILYLRDGISDGQIQTTMANEIKSIFAAYKAAKRPRPLITAISVRKRHHSRLFRADSSADGQERNVDSGTLCYDQLAQSSLLPNFLMVSQQGSLGTSRPTKYQILQDDIGNALLNMKKMTIEEKSTLYGRALYDLCHLHGTCQKAVSLPSPVTWAHKLADRIRLTGEHLARQRLDSTTPIGQVELDTFLEEMNNVTSNIEAIMGQMYWV